MINPKSTDWFWRLVSNFLHWRDRMHARLVERDGLILLPESPEANVLSLCPPFAISNEEIAFVAGRLQEYLTFLPGSIS